MTPDQYECIKQHLEALNKSARSIRIWLMLIQLLLVLMAISYFDTK